MSASSRRPLSSSQMQAAQRVKSCRSGRGWTDSSCPQSGQDLSTTGGLISLARRQKRMEPLSVRWPARTSGFAAVRSFRRADRGMGGSQRDRRPHRQSEPATTTSKPRPPPQRNVSLRPNPDPRTHARSLHGWRPGRQRAYTSAPGAPHISRKRWLGSAQRRTLRALHFWRTKEQT